MYVAVEVADSIEEKQRVIHNIQFGIQEEECGFQVEKKMKLDYTLASCNNLS